jgi:hypothetical protein
VKLESLGKLLLLMGVVFVLSGLVVTLWGRASLVGKLPGDIVIRREGFTLYFPVATPIPARPCSSG